MIATFRVAAVTVGGRQCPALLPNNAFTRLLAPFVAWLESAIGTNGMGTTLSQPRPVWCGAGWTDLL